MTGEASHLAGGALDLPWAWSAYVLHRAQVLGLDSEEFDVSSVYVWLPFRPDGPSGDFGTLGGGMGSLGGMDHEMNQISDRWRPYTRGGWCMARSRGAEASARLMGYGGRGSEV